MDKKIYIKKEENGLTIIGEYKSKGLTISVSDFLYGKPGWFKVQKSKWRIRRTLNGIIKCFI